MKLRVRAVSATFLVCCIGAILAFVAFSLKTREADVSASSANIEQLNAGAPPALDSVAALDQLRSEFAAIQSVEMESAAKVRIFSGKDVITGIASLRFTAKGHKYRYEVNVSEALIKAGLMRNFEVAWNGERFFFRDPALDVLSYQQREVTQLPLSVPNPLFLPIDFLSEDDDNCLHCRLGFSTIRSGRLWAERRTAIRTIESRPVGGMINDLVVVPGGTINQTPFEYAIRIVGKDGIRQVNSISRRNREGSTLSELYFSGHKNVDGLNVTIPFIINFVAREADQRVSLVADFEISRLVLNKPVEESRFSIDFTTSARVWDSDNKQFVK
jgi:hypothetical protein